MLNIITLSAKGIDKFIKYCDTQKKLKIVKEITRKLSEYDQDNYYVKIIENSNDEESIITEEYRKDNIILRNTINSNRIIKEYGNSEEVIVLSESNGKRTAIVKKLNDNEKWDNYIINTIDLFNYDNGNNLENIEIKIEKYKNKEFYTFNEYIYKEDIIDFSLVESKKLWKTSYIDKETGLLYVKENYYNDENESDLCEYTKTFEYTYKFGILADKDLELPDLSQYEIINY